MYLQKSCIFFINPLYVGGNYVYRMILRVYLTTLLKETVCWFCFSEQRNIFLRIFNSVISVTLQRSVFFKLRTAVLERGSEKL